MDENPQRQIRRKLSSSYMVDPVDEVEFSLFMKLKA
jgi:hypothetical protein